MEQTTAPTIAEILDWRYDYRFTGSGPSERVDIDIALTLRKHDNTPIIAGASLFAAGDTTPAGLVDVGPGDYTIQLPIRHFHTLRWYPAGLGGTQKRHLLNLKLTSVAEDEDDEPTIYALRGVTVGFRTVVPLDPSDEELVHIGVNGESITLVGYDWSSISSTEIRSELTKLRDSGVNLLRVPALATANTAEGDSLYGLCDELGLMVQKIVGGESSSQIRQIRSHPCVVLWSGVEIPQLLSGEPGPDSIWL